ncbi:hypothetical protein [Cumulibacter soli]|uniref:hypothetical protein n=1 Tax=Cumulibacter soli TaxID=2546344 RepID=UPI0010684D13|nr:hypothetical protein [Cumulibacter soli]
MNVTRAQELLTAEHARLSALLADVCATRDGDLEAVAQAKTSVFDSAGALSHELFEDVVAEQVSAKLAAVTRAQARLRAGTYGFSLRSGLRIPDDRLEANPAAEYLVGEIE